MRFPELPEVQIASSWRATELADGQEGFFTITVINHCGAFQEPLCIGANIAETGQVVLDDKLWLPEKGMRTFFIPASQLSNTSGNGKLNFLLHPLVKQQIDIPHYEPVSQVVISTVNQQLLKLPETKTAMQLLPLVRLDDKRVLVSIRHKDSKGSDNVKVGLGAEGELQWIYLPEDGIGRVICEIPRPFKTGDKIAVWLGDYQIIGIATIPSVCALPSYLVGLFRAKDKSLQVKLTRTGSDINQLVGVKVVVEPDDFDLPIKGQYYGVVSGLRTGESYTINCDAGYGSVIKVIVNNHMVAVRLVDASILMADPVPATTTQVA